jgi:hypothetical protein
MLHHIALQQGGSCPVCTFTMTQHSPAGQDAGCSPQVLSVCRHWVVSLASQHDSFKTHRVVLPCCQCARYKTILASNERRALLTSGCCMYCHLSPHVLCSVQCRDQHTAAHPAVHETGEQMPTLRTQRNKHTAARAHSTARPTPVSGTVAGSPRGSTNTSMYEGYWCVE